MKGKYVTQHIKRLQNFHQRLNPGVDYYIPPHRFACLDRVDQQISVKKGAYTHAELLNWLSIIHTCLFAPSSYFPNERTAIKRQKVERYERELLKFQHTVQCAQREAGTLGLYIQEIRHVKRNLGNMKHLPCSDELQKYTDLLLSKLTNALKKRIKKEPTLKWDEQYDEAMIRVKAHIETALYAPAAWSFLPYCIFMELATAEGLSSPNLKPEKDPLSLPQCTNSENIFTWSIRSSPFRELNSNDRQQLHSLQKCIQKALTKAMKTFEFTSIGEEAFQALQDWQRGHSASAQGRFLSASSDEEETEHYLCHFYLPIWDPLSWSKLIFKEFEGSVCQSEATLTLTEIQAELNRLFRQTISARGVEKKGKTSKEANLKANPAYDAFSMVYQEKTLTLSSIMLALCTIFDPNQFFTVHPFQQPKLQRAIQLLTDFWACIDFEDTDNITAANCPTSASLSQEEIMYRAKWLMLISYSNDSLDRDTQDIWDYPFRLDEPSTDFFVSPSNELIYSVISKAQSYSVKEQKKNTHLQNVHLQNEANHGNRVAMVLNEGINHVLFCEKDLMDDIVAFTGTRAFSSENHGGYTLEHPSLLQLISIWEHRVASPAEEKRVAALQKHLEKKAGLSQQIYTGLLKSNFQIDLDLHLDLSESPRSSDDYKQVTEELKKQKECLFSFFPKGISKLFEPVCLVSDFEYFLIAYYIVLDLRKNMCQKICRLAATIL